MSMLKESVKIILPKHYTLINNTPIVSILYNRDAEVCENLQEFIIYKKRDGELNEG